MIRRNRATEALRVGARNRLKGLGEEDLLEGQDATL